MNRKYKLFILFLVAILLGIVALYFGNNRAVFTGTSTKTSDCYALSFEKMNQTDSHVLILKKDDILSVEFSIDNGRMDIVIESENEKPIYKGDNISTGKFEVIAPRDGEYRITVEAKHAAGSIAIIKNQ